MDNFGRRAEDSGADTLYTRLKNVEDKLDEQGKTLTDIKHCVLGTTVTIGLMERLRGLEGIAAQVKWLGVTVILVVINAIKDFFIWKH